MHGFGTEVFAYARTQHRAAVGKAGIRRFARAFELPFPTPAVPVFGIAQQQRAPVAQPRGIRAELMAAVHGCQRLRPVMLRAAGEIGEVGGRLKILIQAQCFRQTGIEGHPIWPVQGFGIDARIECGRQLGKLRRLQGKIAGHGKS